MTDAVALAEPEVAVIVVVPSATALTRPVDETLATMDRVRTGDVIFCYVGKAIVAVATAETSAYLSPRPFSSAAGQVWEREGRRIDVTYEFLDPPLRIEPLTDRLLPLMPKKYAPINAETGGNVGYLYELPVAAGDLILDARNRPPVSDSQAAPAATPVPRIINDVTKSWKPRRTPTGGKGSRKASSGLLRHSKRSKEIGDKAEEVVRDWLKENLPGDQGSTVVWAAKEGRHPGWDIEYSDGESRIAVEVKGTTGSCFPNVQVTANEWLAAERERSQYRLFLGPVNTI